MSNIFEFKTFFNINIIQNFIHFLIQSKMGNLNLVDITIYY